MRKLILIELNRTIKKQNLKLKSYEIDARFLSSFSPSDPILQIYKNERRNSVRIGSFWMEYAIDTKHDQKS